MRFYEKGEEPNREYWFNNGEVDMRLNNDNFLANLHEVMSFEGWIAETEDHIYDRVAVEDPEDKEWWILWRAEHGDETFAKLEFMARRCGSLLIRQTVLEQVKTQFDAKFGGDLLMAETIPEEWLEEKDNE